MSPSPRRCLRVAVSASVMSGGGFAAFSWMLEHGSGGEHAGNALLMLMVLFENFHAGYYRSKTRSILILNPLKTPVLLQGMISTCQIHVAALDTPGLPAVLMSEPVAPAVWAAPVALAPCILIAHRCSSRRRGACSRGREIEPRCLFASGHPNAGTFPVEISTPASHTAHS
ncbi:MAG: cation transporting ATPase C-terminal domain-containing protein [Phycisphaeraceae bacterium]|nr:cation transporting ATPase C-terminal domain-containing protein [Phycisphaeraceae bacterium]